MTLLSDGRVFTIGGSWNGGIFIKNGEIWSETEGWKLLPGCPVGSSAEPRPLHAHR
jgi:galactose oxidase